MQLSIPQRETNGRRLFYGIETSEAWLIEYTKTHRKSHGLSVSMSVILNLSEALQLLQRHSGVHTLRIKTVLPENSPIPPARKDAQQSLPRLKCGKPIISLCSSDSRSFQKRPSQVQVDTLKQIMGGKEPKWWVDDADRN